MKIKIEVINILLTPGGNKQISVTQKTLNFSNPGPQDINKIILEQFYIVFFFKQISGGLSVVRIKGKIPSNLIDYQITNT